MDHVRPLGLLDLRENDPRPLEFVLEVRHPLEPQPGLVDGGCSSSAQSVALGAGESEPVAPRRRR